MLGTGTPLHSELSTAFNRSAYCALSSVEQAFERVDGCQTFDEFLRRLGLLLSAFSCGRNFGAFLLHRHFTPSSAQVPLEVPMGWGDSNELALVTRMLNPTCASRLAPSRWFYNTDTELFEALEYSTDPKVMELWLQLLASPRLMSEFALLLREFKLTHLIGLAIVKRRSLPKRDDERYVETSDGPKSASIVRVDSRKPPSRSRYIPTVWIPSKACWCASDTLCAEIGCMTYGSTHIGDPDGDQHYVIDGAHKVVPCV